MSIHSADIGIHFGPKMGNETLRRRYSPLYKALGHVGLTPVILRAGELDYDSESRTFPNFATIDAGTGDVAVSEEPIRVELLRDFSGKRERIGTPAINDQGVWELTRDKNATRLAMEGFVPFGVVLSADRADSEEVRKSMPGTIAVVKPTKGRASKNVSVVDLADKAAWETAVGAISDDDVLVEEYVDTTKANTYVPEAIGRPHTIRVISLDGEPSVVVVRVGVSGDRKVAGDTTEQTHYFDPSSLSESERNIVTEASKAAAKAGNGHSYLGVDLLAGNGRTYLGEVNSRPEIIEPSMDPYWSDKLARDSALHLKKAHANLTKS